MSPKSRSTLPPKPPSSYAIGAGLNRRRLLGNIKWNLLRDNFEISTWLTLGACFQILLFYLPVSHLVATAPALLLLAFKITWTALMLVGIVPNPWYLKPTGTRMYSIPEGAVMGEDGERRAEYAELPGNEEFCVVMIAAQCSHPFGQLAPDYEFDNYTDLMIRDLEKEAETNGFLGATSWLNTSEFTSNNTMMTLLYFKSKKDVNKFQKGQGHRGGSKWNKQRFNKGNHFVGLYQENFVTSKGQWDNFSGTFRPVMFDATTYLVEDENGERRWEPVFEKKMKSPKEYSNRRKIFKDAKKPGSKVIPEVEEKSMPEMKAELPESER